MFGLARSAAQRRRSEAVSYHDLLLCNTTADVWLIGLVLGQTELEKSGAQQKYDKHLTTTLWGGH